jgi:uroporphyrinogen-III decarboxylase
VPTTAANTIIVATAAIFLNVDRCLSSSLTGLSSGPWTLESGVARVVETHEVARSLAFLYTHVPASHNPIENGNT